MTPITRPKRLTRGQIITLWCFVVFLILPGAIGFVDKLVMFFRVLCTDNDGGFTILPVLNYLLVAAGMICMFCWAILHGMFRNIEGPKYDMLEREQALDAAEGIEWDDDPQQETRP